jgi:hypothetical protein
VGAKPEGLFDYRRLSPLWRGLQGSVAQIGTRAESNTDRPRALPPDLPAILGLCGTLAYRWDPHGETALPERNCEWGS